MFVFMTNSLERRTCRAVQPTISLNIQCQESILFNVIHVK